MCNLRGAAVFVTVDRGLAVLGILVEDKEDYSVAAVDAHRLCVAGRAARVPAPHHTDKKENTIFLIYKEIQRDRVQSHI